MLLMTRPLALLAAAMSLLLPRLLAAADDVLPLEAVHAGQQGVGRTVFEAP